MPHHRSSVLPRFLLAALILAFGAACSGTVSGTDVPTIQITNQSGAPIRYEAYTPEVAVTLYRGFRISLAETARTPEAKAEWDRTVIRPGETAVLASVAGDWSYDDTVVFYFYEIGEFAAVRKEIRAVTPDELKAVGYRVIVRD